MTVVAPAHKRRAKRVLSLATTLSLSEGFHVQRLRLVLSAGGVLVKRHVVPAWDPTSLPVHDPYAFETGAFECLREIRSIPHPHMRFSPLARVPEHEILDPTTERTLLAGPMRLTPDHLQQHLRNKSVVSRSRFRVGQGLLKARQINSDVALQVWYHDAVDPRGPENPSDLAQESEYVVAIYVLEHVGVIDRVGGSIGEWNTFAQIMHDDVLAESLVLR